MSESIDAQGIVTVYVYDRKTGGLRFLLQDSEGLRLATNYELDLLGRTIATQGPVHCISIDGEVRQICRMSWTQYLDAAEEVRTFDGYFDTVSETIRIVSPGRIAVTGRPVQDPGLLGWRRDEEISVVYAGSALPPRNQVFSQASYGRWATRYFDPSNELRYSRVYHAIPPDGSGSSTANYAQTEYGYDPAGRQNSTTSPGGTLSFTKLNAMSWPQEDFVGTDETNAVSVTRYIHDFGAGRGDGRLTKLTRLVDEESANDRVTNFFYDWRNRQVAAESSDGTRTTRVERTYDNRDNVVQVAELSSLPPNPLTHLVNLATTSFDSWNRKYASARFGVNPVTGVVQPHPLVSNWSYDSMSRLVRDEPAGRVGFKIMQYDRVGRLTGQFLGYGGSVDEPTVVDNMTVVEQAEFYYDEAGNQVAMTSRQRFDDATGTGELRDPASEPKARVSYMASYPDSQGRSQAEANYGTNGGMPWSRPFTIPERSDTVLVSSSTFNQFGEQADTTDPAGTTTHRQFDQAGRQIALVENYFICPAVAPDINRTTLFAYNDDGNLRQLTAINPTTGDQVTQWVYGVTLAQGSKVQSNALLYQKIYPDSDGPSDRVTYQYNRQSQTIAMTDQAGTAHAYTYDLAGRLLSDAVTAFGPGIDTTVQAIQRTYEARGALETITSLGTGTTVLNQVRLEYNPFSQLFRDYQEHNGAVNLSTTLKVEYAYADGNTNTVRRTGTRYPDGTTFIEIGYEGEAADALSRPNLLQEGPDRICSYRYMGAGLAVGVKYEAASNAELTYQTAPYTTDYDLTTDTNEALLDASNQPLNVSQTGDAGDKYTGLDRFGRLVETLWVKASATPDILVRSQYGRNRFGGITWRRDAKAHSLTPPVTTQDNAYQYDGLYQVIQHRRGNLTGSFLSYTGLDNLQQDENWNYDATGNWRYYSSLDPANAQRRTHDRANEIVGITTSIGNMKPEYDPVGNMLYLPKKPGLETGKHALLWDGWNRLVSVSEDEIVLLSNIYDGLTRRQASTTTATCHHYYNDRWRSLEERVDETPFLVYAHYTWGLQNRWELVRRTDRSGNELFPLSDDLDPVAIVGADGSVQERFDYDAFGNARIIMPDYSFPVDTGIEWNFLFHGEFWDSAVALYNYGFRYFSPSMGVWLSRDRLDYIDGQNMSTYLRNSPMFSRDLLGLYDAILPVGNQDAPMVLGPSALDQLLGYGRYANYALWFEERFPNQVRMQKEAFSKAVDAAVRSKCGSSQSMPSVINGTEIRYFFPFRPKGKSKSYKATEAEGDAPMGWWEIHQSLGQHGYQPTGAIFVTKSNSSRGTCYEWSASLIVFDNPGISDKDEPRGENLTKSDNIAWLKHFGVTPVNSPKVEIARWDLKGSVCCPCFRTTVELRK